MTFLLSIVLVSLAYYIGRTVGTVAYDEVIAGGKYIKLIREAAFLAAVAITAYGTGVSFHYVAPIALLLLIVLWRHHARLYPWLYAITIFLAGNYLITVTTLVFVSAFCHAIYHFKRLEESIFMEYWPLPVTGLVLWLLQFFS